MGGWEGCAGRLLGRKATQRRREDSQKLPGLARCTSGIAVLVGPEGWRALPSPHHMTIAKDCPRWEGCGPDRLGLLFKVNPVVGAEPGVGTAFFKEVIQGIGDMASVRIST